VIVRVRIVHAIFKKEMTDTLRDRRTLVFMLLVPIAAIPLLLMALSSLMTSQIAKEMERVSEVVVQGLEYLPDTLRSELIGSDDLTVVSETQYRAENPTANSDITEDLRLGGFDVLMVVPKAFDRAIEIESPTEIELFYDEAEMKSEFAVSKIKTVLDPYRERIIQARLDQRDISGDIIRPFEIVSENVASMQKVAGEKLGAMLPYLIIIMCFMGAMYPAIDLAAGEKERGTLETLLVSPATRGEFVVGKYLVILTTGITAAILSMGSLTFSLNYMLEDIVGKMNVGRMLAIEFDTSTVILILMIVLPLAGIFAAILLSVSIFARSFKEAQSYITGIYMVLILPAFVSFLPGIEMSYRMALIPIVNVSLIIKDAISGQVEWNYVITAFVSTIVLAALTLVAARKWFERESVLFRM